MTQYICAIDQGTTGTTVIIFDEHINVHARVNQEFAQIFPKAGWVEHDPEVIWSTTQDTIAKACKASGVAPQDIVAVGITNQRETTVVWDKVTGKRDCTV
jgi:glycerol kinase